MTRREVLKALMMAPLAGLATAAGIRPLRELEEVEIHSCTIEIENRVEPFLDEPFRGIAYLEVPRSQRSISIRAERDGVDQLIDCVEWDRDAPRFWRWL